MLGPGGSSMNHKTFGNMIHPSEHGQNKIIPQSKFVKVFMKQKLKCYFLLTLTDNRTANLPFCFQNRANEEGTAGIGS
jgi:hypothetical protein